MYRPRDVLQFAVPKVVENSASFSEVDLVGVTGGISIESRQYTITSYYGIVIEKGSGKIRGSNPLIDEDQQNVSIRTVSFLSSFSLPL